MYKEVSGFEAWTAKYKGQTVEYRLFGLDWSELTDKDFSYWSSDRFSVNSKYEFRIVDETKSVVEHFAPKGDVVIECKNMGKGKIHPLTYLLLEADQGLVTEVVKTLDGLKGDERVINVETYYNGVKYDSTVLEKVLQKLHDQIHSEYKTKYDDVEAEVKKRVTNEVERHLNNLCHDTVEQIRIIRGKLDDLELGVDCLNTRFTY